MNVLTQSDARLMKDLVRELNEFNGYMRAGAGPFGKDLRKGNYFFAFNPAKSTDIETYKKNIRLMNAIDELLDENCINIKSRGYTYIRDAICIITDMRSTDICMTTDIYPNIAEKHGIENKSQVEHNIRNALNSAYRRCQNLCPERDCLINSPQEKPTSKRFLLKAAKEISFRLLKDYRS